MNTLSVKFWSYLREIQRSPWRRSLWKIADQDPRIFLEEDEKKLAEFLLRFELLPVESWSEIKTRAEVSYPQLSQLSLKGLHLLHWGHRAFPEAFRRMQDPPICLQAQGSLEALLSTPILGVVGSREPCDWTLTWMEEVLSRILRETKALIASGAARGVDQKAHALCCAHGRPTIAFLPSGLGQIYPNSFAEMKKQVLTNGGVILSEYDYTEPMRKNHFQDRNRLIAAISDNVIVTESAAKSGTLITAHYALTMGKPLWVVPGHPKHRNFSGSLDLIEEGAFLLWKSEQLLDELKT